MQPNDLIRHLALEKGFSVLVDASEADLDVPADRFEDVDRYAEADEVPDELVDRWLGTIEKHHEALPLVGVEPAEFAIPLERWLSEPLRRLAPLVRTVLVRPIAVQGGLHVTLLLDGEPPPELTLARLQEIARECQAELRGPAERQDGEGSRDFRRRQKARPPVAFDLLVLASAPDDAALRARLRALARTFPGKARVAVVAWHLDPGSGTVWTTAPRARFFWTRYLRSVLQHPISEATLQLAYERADLSVRGIATGTGLAWILTVAGHIGLAALGAGETGFAGLLRLISALVGVAVSIACLRIRRRATEQALWTAGTFVTTFYGALLALTGPPALDVAFVTGLHVAAIGLFAALLGRTSEITP